MLTKLSPKELTIWDKNPRTITDEAMSQLKKSIEKDPGFLEKRPILVNEVDGKYIVYAGNQRCKAVMELGWKEVTVDIEKDIPEEVMEERGIKDNIEYGQFDFAILATNFDKEQLASMDLPEMELDVDAIFAIDDRGADYDNMGQSRQDYDFAENSIKEIKLNYNTDEYVEVLSILDEYMEKGGHANYPDTVLYILREWQKSGN